MLGSTNVGKSSLLNSFSLKDSSIVSKYRGTTRDVVREFINVDNTNKYKTLIDQLEKRDGAVLVFAKTKHSTEKIAKNLKRDGIKADALNGDLRQSKRDKIMRNFRENKIF